MVTISFEKFEFVYRLQSLEHSLSDTYRRSRAFDQYFVQFSILIDPSVFNSQGTKNKSTGLVLAHQTPSITLAKAIESTAFTY